MDWLSRLRRPREHEPRNGASPDPGEAEGSPSPPVERTAPGVTAVFDGLRPDGSHAVLDLGPAAERQLDLYGRYARRIRFADFLTTPPLGAAWAEALEALPPDPLQPYDLVMAWNLLDRLWPEARPPLVARLAEITESGAHLHVLLDVSGEPMTRPLRFTLLEVGRVRQEVVGPAEPAHDPLLPAQVERLLAPFEVVRAFTLRGGLREYVAVKA